MLAVSVDARGSLSVANQVRDLNMPRMRRLRKEEMQRSDLSKRGGRFSSGTKLLMRYVDSVSDAKKDG
jgi:hypothetical protein